jgi:hypothetical protein
VRTDARVPRRHPAARGCGARERRVRLHRVPRCGACTLRRGAA